MESMKKAQELVKQQEQMTKELLDTFFTGQDGSGQATATFNGLGSPINVKVTPTLCSQGSDAVSAAVSQAVVEAHRKAQEAMASRMQNLYAGAGIMPPK